jgi:hypothetical protein
MLSDIGITDLLLLLGLIVGLYLFRDVLRRRGVGWLQSGGRLAAHGVRRILLEALELLLAGVFLVVGGAKLVGRPDMIALFGDIGLGQWFRYVTGVIEVAGGALLVVPLLSGASAMVLGGVMVVATLTELFVLHRPPVAALACLSGHTFVAWARSSHSRRGSVQPVTGIDQVRPPLLRMIEARWAFPRQTPAANARQATTPHTNQRRPRDVVRRHPHVSG